MNTCIRFLLAGVILLPLGCSDDTASPAPEGLEFTVEPASVAVGSPLAPAPVVVVRDREGNVLVDWEEPVSITLVGGSPGAALEGTVTRSPLAGTVVFDDLEVTAPGDGFSLEARSGALSEARSGAFDVHAMLASVQVTAGFSHTCALSSQGEAFCWGDNSGGELGDGTTQDRALPVKVTTDLRFTALSAGRFHTCGVTASGTVHCWGANFLGQLGLGVLEDAHPLPALVTLPGAAVLVDAGGYHTCALLEDGDAYCWGDNATGQLGVGVVGGEYSLPAPVVGGHPFKALAAGYGHTCALTEAGAAYCWGGNRSSELGQGGDHSFEAEPIPSPAPIAGGHLFRDIEVGGDHPAQARSCGMDLEGTWRCWGRAQFSLPRFWTVPTRVEGDPGFQEVIMGGWLLCGLPGDGALFCLGQPQWGMLGEGNWAVGLPTRVAPDLSVVSVAIGYSHVCVSTADQHSYCWGSNQEGQLGSTSNPRGWYVPMPVWAPSGG